MNYKPRDVAALFNKPISSLYSDSNKDDGSFSLKSYFKNLIYQVIPFKFKYEN
jgi:hypothetical protein